MKKVLLILGPLLLAGLVFTGFVFFTKKNVGTGALQVTSLPKSKVYLNGSFIGETPLCKCEGTEMISVGDYSVRLVPEDSSFLPFEGKVTIGRSILTVVDRTFGKGSESSGSIITLEKLDDPKDTQLLIVSFPDKADILLDNTDSGLTPLLLKNVSESDHEVKLIKDGYDEKVVRIRTVLGYKLLASIFMAVNPNIAIEPTASPSATPSATIVPSPSITLSLSPSVTPHVATTSAQVLILQTPTGFLRVRQSPSLAGTEIARVYPGDIFTYLDEKDGWYEITLKNGQTGWISNQYAKKQ